MTAIASARCAGTNGHWTYPYRAKIAPEAHFDLLAPRTPFTLSAMQTGASPSSNPQPSANGTPCRRAAIFVPASTHNDPHQHTIVGNHPKPAVGKIFANWSTFSANWIQLANGCQLDHVSKQSFSSFPVQLAVGRWKFLPTEISHCFFNNNTLHQQHGKVPSYYVGGGAKAPSSVRREEPRPPEGFSVPLLHRTILTLDLGTHTGWALRGPEGRVDSGSQSFRPQRFEGGGMRYLRFKHWLTELKQTADPIHAVYFEEVRRHAGVDAAHAYGGFLAHLTAWCEHHQIPYQGVPVGTIKRHATGKGNADKLAVVNAMRARGYAPADDNEADALALLTWAIETGRG